MSNTSQNAQNNQLPKSSRVVTTSGNKILFPEAFIVASFNAHLKKKIGFKKFKKL